MLILVTMNERQHILSLKTHCSVDLYFFTYIKKSGIPFKNRQRKYNKLSNWPFTAIVLKATNCFNIETHHM